MTSREHEPVTRFLSARASAAEDVVPPLAPPETVEAVAAALRKRAQQRRRRAWFARGAIAATVLVLVGAAIVARKHERAPAAGLQTTPHSSAGSSEWVALAPSAASVPGAPQSVPEGARIRTEQAGTILSFHEVTQVSVHDHSSVELVQQGRTNILRLDQGSLSAHVKKLTPDERFIVRTGDAEVEVRGTTFHVHVVPPESTCGEGTTTRVRVDEGTVVVRRGGVEHAIHVGEVWPLCQEAHAASTLRPTTSSAPSAQRVGASAGHGDETSSPPSSLAAQNDRFARAMALKKAGDARSAVRVLEGLLREFPSGPLVESATVERMNLLATFDPPRAKAAAADYLRAYPSGFGRAHARALVGSEP